MLNENTVKKHNCRQKEFPINSINGKLSNGLLCWTLISKRYSLIYQHSTTISLFCYQPSIICQICVHLFCLVP